MAIRKYEAFYMVRPDLSDGDISKIVDRFKGIVEQNNGTVDTAAKWDKRKLAYEVAGLKEANYILMTFSAEGKVPAELARLMRISDDIIRHIIVSVDDSVTTEDVAAAVAVAPLA
jgi:small subunit ribosomal protein S6